MVNPVPYGVKRVLDMTRQHRILDATAFLLEKAGDYAGAYALVHATLKEKVAAFNDAHVEWLNSEPGESPHVHRNSVCIECFTTSTSTSAPVLSLFPAHVHTINATTHSHLCPLLVIVGQTSADFRLMLSSC